MTPENQKLMKAVMLSHVCLDIAPKLPSGMSSVITPGNLTAVGPASLTVGGGVKTAYSLEALGGVEPIIVGGIGDDPFGRILANMLRQSGDGKIRQTGIRLIEGADTSYTIVMEIPGKDRTFYHHTGANDLITSEHVSDNILQGADWFHMAYPTLMKRFYCHDGRELAKLFERAKQAGATTSLDVTMVDSQSPAGKADWSKILKNVLPHVDYFLPSFDEIVAMWKLDADSQALRHNPTYLFELAASLALDKGAGTAVIKLGERGIYARRYHEKGIWVEPYRVKVNQTTGTGDCAIGAFIWACLHGKPLIEALWYASMAGAYRVSEDPNHFPTREELIALADCRMVNCQEHSADWEECHKGPVLYLTKG